MSRYDILLYDMHHALLHICNKENAAESISKYKEELSIDAADVRIYEREKFLVEDARDLVRAVRTTPLAGENTLTVIVAEKIGREAQNALLKVTEEPPVHAYILLIVPNEDMLLPTLRSRFVLIDGSLGESDMSVAEKFLGDTLSARRKVTEKISKDKDVFAAKKLIRDLEVLIGSRKDREQYIDALSDLGTFRQYVEQQGAGIKLMLEHLAIVLPQIK